MKTRNAVKILWLTDIHFTQAYESLCLHTDAFNNFMTQFFARIITLHDSKEPIDYVLISGDLSQNGTMADYECLFTFLLSKLLNTFLDKQPIQLPKVICIPGNHDVNWKNSGFLDEFVQAMKYSRPERVDFLHGHEKAFKNLFADYSSFLNKCAADIKYKPFFDWQEDKSVEVSTGYVSDHLYGHIVDYSRNIIIILLNSAWYSLGSQFDAIYAQDLARKSAKQSPPPEQTAAYFKKILTDKDQIIEYNKQVSGVGFLDKTSLNNLFKDFPDFTVMAVMHHSINWLGWSEYYTYDKKENHSANSFRSILDKTDVLCTGHEHTPIKLPHEEIAFKTIHLKGGCFLFDKQDKKLSLSDCWFSILKIQTGKGILKHEKYYYDDSPGNESWRLESDPTYPDLVKKSGSYELTPRRLQYWQEKHLFFSDEKCLQQYLNDMELLPQGLLLKKISQVCPNAYFYSPEDHAGELYILATGENFYHSLHNPFLEKLDNLIQQSDRPIEFIRFLVPDLYVNSKCKNLYQENKKPRQEILESIVWQADRFFDHWRNFFFMRLSQSDPAIAAPFDFNMYRDLKLINHVIPYFVMEKYGRAFATITGAGASIGGEP